MSLPDAGQRAATPPTYLSASPAGGTQHATTATTSSPDTRSAPASWVEGADTEIAVESDQQATANTATQKIASPSFHWECPAPGTAGANMIAAHSAVTGIYTFGTTLLVYFTVEATKACLANQDSDPSAASAHRTNAIACGIGAGAFLACGVAWGLKYLKSSIEQGMIHRHA